MTLFLPLFLTHHPQHSVFSHTGVCSGRPSAPSLRLHSSCLRIWAAGLCIDGSPVKRYIADRERMLHEPKDGPRLSG